RPGADDGKSRFRPRRIDFRHLMTSSTRSEPPKLSRSEGRTRAEPASPSGGSDGRRGGAVRSRLRALGASPDHEARVLRQWVTAQPQDAGKRRIEDFLPLALRNALPQIAADLAGLATLQSEHPGEDGSARLLVGLNDGQTVESVLLPRDGLCVSTQVGCAVGC